jgi:hypothetical protein
MYDDDNSGTCCEQSEAIFAEDGGVKVLFLGETQIYTICFCIANVIHYKRQRKDTSYGKNSNGAGTN